MRIDEFTREESLEKVKGFLRNGGQHMVFTPNPEMLVDAQKDTYFQEVLNNGDLNLCDGKGIEMFSGKKVHRVSGVNFMQEVCRVAAEEGRTVYLLGSGNSEVVEACKLKLEAGIPGLKVVGHDDGIKITMEQLNNGTMVLKYTEEENERILNNIILTAPDILFVAFGHGKQEKWIYENLPHLPSVKLAMGVGGSFDFISGKVKRAPLILRKVGLEWLWRLVLQPWRIKRIWKATVVFPLMILKERYAQ